MMFSVAATRPPQTVGSPSLTQYCVIDSSARKPVLSPGYAVTRLPGDPVDCHRTALAMPSTVAGVDISDVNSVPTRRRR